MRCVVSVIVAKKINIYIISSMEKEKKLTGFSV